MNLTATLANTAWLAASLPAHRRFIRALDRPAETQWRLLRANLARNAATAYGRAHDFARISSYAEFARRVPIVSHEELAPWIERIRNGEPAVLTRDPVTRLLPTSGTTNGRKLIPFTTGLQREFNAAIGPWMCDLARRHPATLLGPGYWSVTPLAIDSPQETSAVPVGFDDDSRYLGGARGRLIDLIMAVPSAVRHIGDIAAFRHVVLLHLLRQSDLRLISVWHPSFLSLLLDTLNEHWDSLLCDLADGTCRYRDELSAELSAALRMRPAPTRARQLRTANPTQPETVWPALRIVSCWADGHAAGPAAELQRRLPNVVLQPKGLLATEAFVTLPFAGANPLALNSHFFEFVDEHGTIHTASALRVGECYEMIVTTSGGLYRYRLGDRVEVTRLLQRAPCLRFLGRDRVADEFGEKLSESFVSCTLAELCPHARFALLAPEQTDGRWHYVLFVEQPFPAELATRLDTALCANPNYALCRQLGQLAAAEIYPIEGDGYARFITAETARGVRLGDIKPMALSTRTGWSRRFGRVAHGRAVSRSFAVQA